MAGMRLVVTSFTVGLLQVCCLSAQSTWTQLSPQGPIPPARYSHAAVYNPTSNRLIVFGGAAGPGGSYTNDVWVMANANGVGTPSWIQLFANGAPGSPPPRLQHSAVYDVANNRMIVFGGFAPNLSEYNDVWVLTNADGTGGTPAWIQLTPLGSTPARCNHGAIYDATSNRMIIFLGDTRGYLFPGFSENATDVWALANANGLGGTPVWSQLSPSGSPPPGRWVNSINSAYDPASNRLILYGGVAGKPNDQFTYGDSWVLTNANGLTGTPAWQQLSPTGTAPIARSGTSGFYDAATNRMVIYGGTFDPGDYPSLADTWILSNANGIGTPFWQQVLPQGTQIPARRLHQAVYDNLRNLMIIYGGQLTAGSSLPSTSETWVLSDANGLGVSQQLRIDAVTPNHGGNAGTVTVQLTGAGFQSGAGVKLTGLGPDVLGANTQWIDAGVVTTTFNLTGTLQGSRTITLTNPDSSSVALMGGFTVDQGGTPQLSMDILGRPQLRLGASQNYYLLISNHGNVDASSLATSIAVSAPSSAQNFDVSPLADVYQSATVGQVQSFVIPSLPAGSTESIPLTLTAPFNATAFSLRAQYQSLSASLASASRSQSTTTSSTASSLLGGLLFGPPLFDGCSQPLQGCSACNSSWNAYNAQLNLATNAQTASHQADLAFDYEALLVASDITEGLAATAEIALIAPQFLGAIGLAGDSASQLAVGTLLQYGHDAFKGLLVNDPTSGITATGNLALNISQFKAIYNAQFAPLVKTAAQQAVANEFLAALGGLETVVGSISSAWTTLNQLWSERRDSRNIFSGANANLCAAASSYLQCLNTSCGGGKSLPPDTGTDAADLQGTTVSSLDPNAKIGASGIGPLRYVSGAGLQPYAIYFENQSAATAPAQSVTITDTLNNNLDLTALMLGSITFPSQLVTPPPIPLSVSPFTTTVDLRPTTNLLVKVTASLNTATATLTATFQSLDPTTNQPPTDPLAGFLPPGAEGSVFFSILPKSTATTGTVISNTATVVFDVNAPINTPTWTNTIDNTPPTSHVSTLPAQNGSIFSVQWSGTDIGAGVGTFTIYVSDDGAPSFAPWLSQTTATSSSYNGQIGHSYSFYSIARDLVGNIELAKTSPDATTQVTHPSQVPSSAVSVTASGLAYSRVSQTFNGTVTIQNISSQTVYGPFEVVFTGLTSGVALLNPTGFYNANAYLAFPNLASLPPGQSATANVQFKNSSSTAITFVPVVYSGSLN